MFEWEPTHGGVRGLLPFLADEDEDEGGEQEDQAPEGAARNDGNELLLVDAPIKGRRRRGRRRGCLKDYARSEDNAVGGDSTAAAAMSSSSTSTSGAMESTRIVLPTRGNRASVKAIMRSGNVTMAACGPWESKETPPPSTASTLPMRGHTPPSKGGSTNATTVPTRHPLSGCGGTTLAPHSTATCFTSMRDLVYASPPPSTTQRWNGTMPLAAATPTVPNHQRRPALGTHQNSTTSSSGSSNCTFPATLENFVPPSLYSMHFLFYDNPEPYYEPLHRILQGASASSTSYPCPPAVAGGIRAQGGPLPLPSPTHTPQQRVIGILGPQGSGKTTLTLDLCRELVRLVAPHSTVDPTLPILQRRQRVRLDRTSGAASGSGPPARESLGTTIALDAYVLTIDHGDMQILVLDTCDFASYELCQRYEVKRAQEEELLYPSTTSTSPQPPPESRAFGAGVPPRTMPSSISSSSCFTPMAETSSAGVTVGTTTTLLPLSPPTLPVSPQPQPQPFFTFVDALDASVLEQRQPPATHTHMHTPLSPSSIPSACLQPPGPTLTVPHAQQDCGSDTPVSSTLEAVSSCSSLDVELYDDEDDDVVVFLRPRLSSSKGMTNVILPQQQQPSSQHALATVGAANEDAEGGAELPSQEDGSGLHIDDAFRRTVEHAATTFPSGNGDTTGNRSPTAMAAAGEGASMWASISLQCMGNGAVSDAAKAPSPTASVAVLHPPSSAGVAFVATPSTSVAQQPAIEQHTPPGGRIPHVAAEQLLERYEVVVELLYSVCDTLVYVVPTCGLYNEGTVRSMLRVQRILQASQARAREDKDSTWCGPRFLVLLTVRAYASDSTNPLAPSSRSSSSSSSNASSSVRHRSPARGRMSAMDATQHREMHHPHRAATGVRQSNAMPMRMTSYGSSDASSCFPCFSSDKAAQLCPCLRVQYADAIRFCHALFHSLCTGADDVWVVDGSTIPSSATLTHTNAHTPGCSVSAAAGFGGTTAANSVPVPGRSAYSAGFNPMPIGSAQLNRGTFFTMNPFSLYYTNEVLASRLASGATGELNGLHTAYMNHMYHASVAMSEYERTLRSIVARMVTYRRTQRVSSPVSGRDPRERMAVKEFEMPTTAASPHLIEHLRRCYQRIRARMCVRRRPLPPATATTTPTTITTTPSSPEQQPHSHIQRRYPS